MGGDGEESSYRGAQWLMPVRESVRTRREGPKLITSPPKDYGGGDIKVGDRVYIIPGCSTEAEEGGPGIAVEPEGPAWLAERGWIGVLTEDGDISNYQKKCLWKHKD